MFDEHWGDLCGDNMCFGSTCHREVMNIGASCRKVELYNVQGRFKVISSVLLQAACAAIMGVSTLQQPVLSLNMSVLQKTMPPRTCPCSTGGGALTLTCLFHSNL